MPGARAVFLGCCFLFAWRLINHVDCKSEKSVASEPSLEHQWHIEAIILPLLTLACDPLRS